jgi:hypothetical protein
LNLGGGRRALGSIFELGRDQRAKIGASAAGEAHFRLEPRGACLPNRRVQATKAAAARGHSIATASIATTQNAVPAMAIMASLALTALKNICD